MIENYEKKRILILGMGVSGKATADYLYALGADLICVDSKAEELRQRSEYAKYSIFSEQDSLQWDQIDLIVKSPGIPFTHPLMEQSAGKVPVTSEIELACQHLKKKQKTLFAITGSNGKTTTTLLATHILNYCGRKAMAVGNIGASFLSAVNCDAECFIVELSSFQIEMISYPVFDAGIILNITPNHLDRYPSFKAYALAKLGLERSLKEKAPLYLQKKVLDTFGHLLMTAQPVLFPPLHSNVERPLMGDHDLENMQAALALCQQMGFSEKQAWDAFQSFHKPPHRIEFVGSYNGIHFVNDSKATSVDAVLKAVQSISGKLILIAGGVDKGGAYHDWIPSFRGKVKRVFAIGQAADRIQKELDIEIPVEKMEDLQSAFRKAYLMAEQGETVLLSPGCSSYDQFRDYQERGERFKHYFSSLGEIS